jgi:hydroxylaminobenzene mutase
MWHGVLLFLLGLVGGMFIYSMANPRMGLTAHVGAVTNGTYLIALGAGWSVLVLAPRLERWAFWQLVVGSYGSNAALLLAAILATRNATPLHGAAQSASAGKEAVVTLSLIVFGIAVMVGTALALWGFGRRAAAAT